MFFLNAFYIFHCLKKKKKYFCCGFYNSMCDVCTVSEIITTYSFKTVHMIYMYVYARLRKL